MTKYRKCKIHIYFQKVKVTKMEVKMLFKEKKKRPEF